MRSIEKTSKSNLSTLTTDELVERLRGLLQVTERSIIEMAEIVGLLEERGFDLSELRIGMIDHLRRVADKSLLPAAIVRFHGIMLSRVAQLPKPDQQKLIDSERVKLAVINQDGTVTHVLCKPERLSRAEVMQLLDGGHIRSEAEQLSYLRSRGAAPAKSAPS